MKRLAVLGGKLPCLRPVLPGDVFEHDDCGLGRGVGDVHDGVSDYACEFPLLGKGAARPHLDSDYGHCASSGLTLARWVSDRSAAQIMGAPAACQPENVNKRTSLHVAPLPSPGRY